MRIDKCLCDQCRKEIENPDACGFGVKYKLTDYLCDGCGGYAWEFCSLKCLKEFVRKVTDIKIKNFNLKTGKFSEGE